MRGGKQIGETRLRDRQKGGGRRRDKSQRQKRISAIQTSRNKKEAEGGLDGVLAFWLLSTVQD